MIKKLIVEQVKINHNLSLRDALVKGMRVFKDFEEQADENKKHYIYLNGQDVSDLVIIYFNRGWKARKCTSQEWKEFFNTHLYETNDQNETLRSKIKAEDRQKGRDRGDKTSKKSS